MAGGSIVQSVLFAFGLAGACYVTLCGMLALALGRVRTGTQTKQPPVTVVVAARNEQDTIGRCLEALQRQTYPQDLFEVTCVNDRSNDRTGEILSAWTSRWDRLRVLTIETVPAGTSPKKHALTRAIADAQGEFVLETDADCEVPPEWIASTVRRFDPSVDLVAGVAPYREGTGVVAGFVRHEYFWNILLSAGSIVLGFGTHASGRNLAFRRAVFEELDGYAAHRGVLSGDDTLLMQQVQRRRSGSVATNPDPLAHVYTNPPETFRTLVRQRIRHMSTGRLFHPAQLAAGVTIYGFHIGILALFAASLWMPAFVWCALAGFAMKIAVDAMAFRRVERVFGMVMSWREFLFNELLMLLYFTVFPILGAIVPVRWKENS